MLISPNIKSLIKLALQEDYPSGDLTSEHLIKKDRTSSAKIIAREELIICGIFLIEEIIKTAGAKILVKNIVEDGQLLGSNQVIAELKGNTREILTLERTILNFLQKLSGIATQTRRFVKLATPIFVYDTRKTTPGYRALEKYAVRIGGGKNHRFSLSDMILIKNNHVDSSNLKLDKLILNTRSKLPISTKIEVEVRNLVELKEAIKGAPEIIMLDNFSDKLIREALLIIKKASYQPLVEISGQVNIDRLNSLKKLGVKAVSTSALVTKASWSDISLRVKF